MTYSLEFATLRYRQELATLTHTQLPTLTSPVSVCQSLSLPSVSADTPRPPGVASRLTTYTPTKQRHQSYQWESVACITTQLYLLDITNQNHLQIYFFDKKLSFPNSIYSATKFQLMFLQCTQHSRFSSKDKCVTPNNFVTFTQSCPSCYLHKLRTITLTVTELLDTVTRWRDHKKIPLSVKVAISA